MQAPWIDFAPFCCVWYINYARYLSDKTTNAVKRSDTKQENVWFEQIFSPRNRLNRELICIIAIKDFEEHY